MISVIDWLSQSVCDADVNVGHQVTQLYFTSCVMHLSVVLLYSAQEDNVKNDEAHEQCRGKLLLKVMHYNIALLPKKSNYLRYLVTFYGK